MNANDGWPAFPLQSIGPEFPAGYCGMTLRDYFAAKAMQSLILDREFLLRGHAWNVADRAYEYADEMLKASAK